MIATLIALAGGVGAALRYLVMLWLPAQPQRFPWALALVNTLGAFLIMLAAAYSAGAAQEVLMGGLFGGFTTFSAASQEAALLWQAGKRAQAVGVSAALFVLACLAALAGWFVAPLMCS